MITGVTKCERNVQQFDPSIQPLNLREMQQMWEIDRQEERLAIARRAYELFETRGCEQGREWEDWFRAELELHLNE